MSNITKDDLRAAVAAGKISEAQAASVIALAEARHGVRENMDGLDEPFELFKGFNEIFIVVGLSILCTGYFGVTSAMAEGIGMIITAMLGMALIAWLSRYFVLTRRMVAPAIALSIMFSIFASQFGLGLGDSFGLAEAETMIPLAALITAVAMLGFWKVFHVPFALFVTASAVFVAAFGFTALSGANLENPEDLFLLTADGPFSIITIVLGVIALGIALRFDMSDPHRVTRRASNAFWLHVVAAPAIVNTVALTLFNMDGALALLGVFAFISLMALFAVAIDRRSFLISGVGYAVALAVTVADGGVFFIILALGVGLVFLGAKWERLRSALMNRLPDFTGKDRLPPWDEA